VLPPPTLVLADIYWEANEDIQNNLVLFSRLLLSGFGLRCDAGPNAETKTHQPRD
jgi:hypothetical protein